MTTHETDLGNVRAALFAAVASLGLMGGAPLAQVPTATQPKQAEIRGTVRAADTGLALRNAEVRLSGGPLKSPPTFSISASGAGRFVAPEVPPGKYLIQVRPGAASPEEFANQEIDVMGLDIEDIMVQTATPATIRGRIVLDEPELGPKRLSDAFRMAPRFVGNTTSRGQVSLAPDGTFEISGILGRGTLLAEDRTNTWFLDRIESDGRDLSDQVLDFKALDGRSVEVALTRRPATISGVAVDRQDAPAQEYVVIAFSEDRERWREPTRYVMRSRPDQHAQFRLAGLPPGTYHVAALRDLEDGKEFDAEFLQALRAVSTRLTLEKHATLAVRLTLVQAPH